MQNKQRIRLWTGEYIIALVLNALPIATTSMLVTTLPLFAVSHGSSQSDAGLVTMVFTISALVFRPITGYLCDTRGRKLVMLVGLGVTIIACCLYGWASSLVLLLSLRFIHGAGFSAQSTSGSTMLADVVPKSRRSEGIGHAGIVGSTIAAIGPALGLSILSFSGFPPLFLTAIAICAAGLILTLIFKDRWFSAYKDSNQSPLQVKKPHLPFVQRIKAFSHQFIEKTTLPVSLVLLFIAICIGGVISFLPVYAAAYGIKDISPFFWVYAAALIVSRPLVGWLGNKIGVSKLILPGIGFLIVSFILLGAAKSSPMFLLSGLVYGLGLGLVQPALAAIVVILCPEDRRGVANATFFSTMDLGVAIGAGVWGIVAAVAGLPAIFFGSAICVVLSGLAYLIFLRKQIQRFREEGNSTLV